MSRAAAVEPVTSVDATAGKGATSGRDVTPGRDAAAPMDATPGEGAPVAEIPLPILERIRAEAVAAYPEECCGFLVGRRETSGGAADAGPRADDRPGGDEARARADAIVRVLDAPATPNVAGEESRRREFFVEPEALLRITKELRERDEELVGFYHSHPDHPAELSPTDLRFARLWPRTAWLIVPVEGAEAGRERAWWIPARSALDAGPAYEQPQDAQDRTRHPHDRTQDPRDRTHRSKDPENPKALKHATHDTNALKHAIHEMTVRSPGTPGRTSTPRGDRQ